MISCLGAPIRHLLMPRDFQLSSVVTSQYSKKFFLEKVSGKSPGSFPESLPLWVKLHLLKKWPIFGRKWPISSRFLIRGGSNDIYIRHWPVCWTEQLKIIEVSNFSNCFTESIDFGMAFGAFAKPNFLTSKIQFWISISFWTV